MPAPQATVSFPGVPPDAVIGADYTLGHGITPGVCNLRVVLGANVKADVGNLVFRFGEVKLTFPDCALQSGSLQLGRSGHVWSLRIFDRRWKWEYGRIDGRYNVRGADGKLDKRLPEKSPRELATLLLRAMRESGFDVSALPDSARPEIDWFAANPAQELAELCESLGCRVVLGSDNRVRICRTGRGKELPDGGLAMNAGLGIERTIPPDSIRLVLGPSVAQSALRLEAVGEETDGSIIPIEKLSYRPEEGWGDGPANAKPGPSFVRDGVTMTPPELAEKTVFRMYRVKEQAGGGLMVPGLDLRVRSIEQYVLRERLLSDAVDSTGKRYRRPAFVTGVYYDNRADVEGNTKPGTLYPYGFTIDSERQLVIFNQPVFKSTPVEEHAPAELYLTTSYTVLKAPGGRPFRLSLTRKTGQSNGTGERIEHRGEIFQTVRVLYAGTRVVGIVHNLEKARLEADVYLDALEHQYKDVDRTSDVQYAGLVDINPDGAIQQVSWRVGDGAPAVTRASRNTEGNFYVPSYLVRRRRERRARAEREAAAKRKAPPARPTRHVP